MILTLRGTTYFVYMVERGGLYNPHPPEISPTIGLIELKLGITIVRDISSTKIIAGTNPTSGL